MNIHIHSFALACVAIFAASISLHAADDSTPPASYPLKTCVVSDEPLGGHGKPIKVTAEGTDVYLCCKMCKKDLEKNPAKYTKMVKDAAAAKSK